ncbi:hypothetical protein [Blastomonas sp.]|uniref:hypothetical protein n=1 Tax=Blastomonas sp. TaxID=1909299 RepID=UPI0035943870
MDGHGDDDVERGRSEAWLLEAFDQSQMQIDQKHRQQIGMARRPRSMRTQFPLNIPRRGIAARFDPNSKTLLATIASAAFAKW